MNSSALPAFVTERPVRRRIRPASRQALSLRLAALLLCALIVLLPLMMGNRTPFTLSSSLLVMVVLSLAAVSVPTLAGRLALPDGAWLWVLGLLSALVVVQVWPSTLLARLFGPYPDSLWQHPDFTPRHWSPNPGASLRGWAAFIALLAIAWLGRSLPTSLRQWVLLAIVATALFQAIYGLLAHATGAQSIFGIWVRHGTDWVHGSFSNRNLFSAYLALIWPLAVGIWFMREVPALSKLPGELKVTGSILCGSILGTAMLASGSRLGAAAGVFGMLLALVLWTRHRKLLHGLSAWPVYLAAAGAFVAALWYGLTPLAERLIATPGEGMRLDVFAIMLKEFPGRWYLHGTGLGGFEAAFRPFQPGQVTDWWDYAHNDLLQWLVETGLVGAVLVVMVVAGLIRRFKLSTERIALYAGLAALGLVAMGDFSWHIPASQVVLAFYLGVLLR